MRHYFDSSSIIYAVESVLPFATAVIGWVVRAEASRTGRVLTSRLSMLECRVKPLRDGDAELLTKFHQFFSHRTMEIIEINAPVIERPTELLATYGFNTTASDRRSPHGRAR